MSVPFCPMPHGRRVTELPPMTWDLIRYTRAMIHPGPTVAFSYPRVYPPTNIDQNTKTVKALLLPDGRYVDGWVWVRVPVHHGLDRAFDVDEVDTDLWFDACRGTGESTSDLTNRSFQIDRYPLDEPCDLEHSYTVVVASQRTDGPFIYPVNMNLKRLIPDLDTPWRGNVLVFRHGKTSNKVLVNVVEKDLTGIKWILGT
ncbi:hypothetical protein C8R47DRAFT_1064862 [Mycena vitilis]|nr:hypothetical protein C8R47DRAFT_1213294 [Mycena vitilis]KAJ6512265.1 hypothetical protein C8R47DRAFT_1064862 [Mycena vitilis]